MISKTQIARTAAAKAMRLRSRFNVPPGSTVDPVDLAAKLGIQVHFEPLPSLEGLYVAGKRPRIILGSDRPSGRRNFTCAHEIGHFAHGHGTRVDEYRLNKRPYDPDEFAADRFAAALLMPRIAVEKIFASRGWNTQDAAPEQMFVVAAELGVGYSTLVTNLTSTLKLISYARAKMLRQHKPQRLKATLAGHDIEHHLVVVDKEWMRSTLELEVGDVALVSGAIDDPSGRVRIKQSVNGHMSELIALAPGEAGFYTQRCRGKIRIVPRRFKGLADYRHFSVSTVQQREALA